MQVIVWDGIIVPVEADSVFSQLRLCMYVGASRPR